MTAYWVSLGVPRAMVWFVAGLLRDKRRVVGTRKGTGILTCFRQAAFILAWMRDGGDIERLDAGFGMSRAFVLPSAPRSVSAIKIFPR